MKLKLTSMVVISTLGLAACNDKTPDCSSEKARETIADIMNNKLSKELNYNNNDNIIRSLLSNLKHSVTSVIVKDYNDKVDNYQCTATWSAEIPESKLQIIIKEKEENIQKELLEYLKKKEIENSEIIKAIDEEFRADLAEHNKSIEEIKNNELKEYRLKIKNLENKEQDNEINYSNNLKTLGNDITSESYKNNKEYFDILYQQEKRNIEKIKEELGTEEDLIGAIEDFGNAEYLYYEAQQKKDELLGDYNIKKQEAENQILNLSRYEEIFRNGFSRDISYTIESVDNGKDFRVSLKLQ